MNLLRLKLDAFHCALLAVIVIIAVYIALGSNLFNVEAFPPLSQSLQQQLTQGELTIGKEEQQQDESPYN
jgi:hypothetical protein